MKPLHNYCKGGNDSSEGMMGFENLSIRCCFFNAFDYYHCLCRGAFCDKQNCFFILTSAFNKQ